MDTQGFLRADPVQVFERELVEVLVGQPALGQRVHIGVRWTPGATAFTRTPNGAHSPAVTFAMISTAAFAAQYASRPGFGEKPRIDEMWITEPERCSIIARPAARVQKKYPVCMTAIV